MRLRLCILVTMLAAPPVALAGAPPGSAPVVAAQKAPALYFDRAITAADLKDRTLRELSLMRNTIYARTGRIYHNAWLHDYFREQPWYTPTETPDAKVITKLDWENASRIAAAEAHQNKATLEARAGRLRTLQQAGKIKEHQRVELRLLSARLGHWVGAADKKPEDRTPFEDPSLLDKQLTKAQLHDMSRRKLRLLRNMIFARRGYAFKSDLMREYFSYTDWYTPDPKYTPARLTRLDWRNVKLIKSLEHTMGGPMTDWEHMEAEGWFAGA